MVNESINGKILIKENGHIRMRKYNKNALGGLKKKGHLCGNCALLFANKCPKVCDADEQDLRDYDFITDGVEIINDSRMITNFYVTGCNNFIKDNREVTPDSKAQDELRGDLKTFYFGADNLKEANMIQKQELQAGRIYEYDPARAK